MDKQQNILLKSYFRSRMQATNFVDDDGESYDQLEEHEKYYILNQSNDFQKFVYKSKMIPIKNTPYFVVDMHKIEESEFYYNGYQIWPTLKIVGERFNYIDPRKVNPNDFFNAIKDQPKYSMNTDDDGDYEYYWDDPNKKRLISDVKRFFYSRNEDKFAENIEDIIPSINAIVLLRANAVDKVIDFNKKPINLADHDVSLDNLDSYSLETPYISQKMGGDFISYSSKLKNGLYVVGGDIKSDSKSAYKGYVIDKNFNDAKDKVNIQDLNTTGDYWFFSSALVGKPIIEAEPKTIGGIPQIIIKDIDNKKYVARMSDNEFKVELIPIN